MADWLRTGLQIPEGGIVVLGTYRRGRQESFMHIPLLNPVLSEVIGGKLFEGSVNVYVDSPIHFPDPAIREIHGERWSFAPVVLNEQQVGVAVRKVAPAPNDFVEVFARHELVPRLGIAEGTRITLRVLPGKYLDHAA